MEKIQRIDSLEPTEAVIMSFGLASLMVWLAREPFYSFASHRFYAMPSFIFVFGFSCVLLSFTNMPGSGKYSRMFWIAPCILLLMPFYQVFGVFMESITLLFSAAVSALLFCRWMTLYARYSITNFILLYLLSSLFSILGEAVVPASPEKAVRFLVICLPFISTGLLLLSTGKFSWLPEVEFYPAYAISLQVISELFVFSLIINGIDMFLGSRLDYFMQFSFSAIKNLAFLLFIIIIMALIHRKKPSSYKTLVGVSVVLWSLGVIMTGVYLPFGILFLEGGCVLFEAAFWFFIVQIAASSPNPARMICTGGALISFAMLSSRFLLRALMPLISSDVFSLNAGIFLFIGIISTLFLFFPTLRFSSTPADAETSFLMDTPAFFSKGVRRTAVKVHEERPEAKIIRLSKEDEEFLLREHFMARCLTKQETRITFMLIEGIGDDEISTELFISRNTIKFHVRNIIRKLEIANRRELPSLISRVISSAGRAERV